MVPSGCRDRLGRSLLTTNPVDGRTLCAVAEEKIQGLDPALLGVLQRVRAGDATATSSLDAMLRPRLDRYFRAGPWPPEDAEDLVQKALTRVFLHVNQLARTEAFLPWLFTIARNVRATARERSLARQRIEVGGLELVERRAAPELAEQERPERLAALEKAIDALPPRQRQCLRLQLRSDLSYEEIAATLRLSENTVRNHLALARESLRRALTAPEEI